VNVAAGALGGTGVISGPVNISPGGTLAPGAGGIGTLTVNNVLTNTGVTAIKVNKSGTTLTNDSVKGVSTLSFAGTLTVTNIGSGILTAGDSFKIFSATNYSGAFTTLSPATPGPGLVWNTNNLLSSGTLAVALGNIQPQFGPVIVQGTNLVLSGTGGAAGYPYSVLSSTNLGAPLTNWNVIGTAAFDRSGDFAFTNLPAPQVPERFYVIQVR
jgi:fibronectin-binding autotransporter adhesin